MIWEKIIFRPRRLPPDFAFKSHYPLAEHQLDFRIGADEFRISVVHLKTSRPTGAVFFLHGNLHHIQYHLPRVEEFLKHRYDVFMMDYPGYGKSRGRFTEPLLHEVVEATYQKMLPEMKALGKVVIAGRSLGTALASGLASKVQPHKVILISPYYNMPDLFRHHSRFFSFQNLKFRFENNVYLQHSTCETFILHGAKDRLIPIALSMKLRPLLKDPGHYIEVPDGNHMNVHTCNAYRQALGRILGEQR
jgi:pimeloyl-ACP methyl ester carboxylesterase